MFYNNNSYTWVYEQLTGGIESDALSCGIFLLMHAEGFMKDNGDMKSINQSGVIEYRKKICNAMLSYFQ